MWYFIKECWAGRKSLPWLLRSPVSVKNSLYPVSCWNNTPIPPSFKSGELSKTEIRLIFYSPGPGIRNTPPVKNAMKYSQRSLFIIQDPGCCRGFWFLSAYGVHQNFSQVRLEFKAGECPVNKCVQRHGKHKCAKQRICFQEIDQIGGLAVIKRVDIQIFDVS